MKRSILAVLATLAFATSSFADIPRPDSKNKKQTAVDAYMTISLDRDAKDARLVIPRSQLAQLRAALNEAEGADPPTAFAGITRTQTIVSGLFLSLAIVFGGVWFARSGKLTSRTGRSAAAVSVIAALGSAATLVLANAGPPPEARSITGKMFTPAVHMYKSGSGRVKLELGDGDRVQLIVPDPAEKKDADE
jgi:hypothetical protein